MTISPLIPHIREHFATLADRLRTFDYYEFQAEGWFKGELIHLLHRDANMLGIERVDREVRVDGGRVDVAVHMADGRTAWIELKHWRIGKQRGTLWTFASTVQDPGAFGLIKDVSKLTNTPCRGSGFALLLLTASPGRSDWDLGVEILNRKLGPNRVEAMTDPADFPPTYFLGVLRASRDA
ncbi:MAG: hypothetical protein KF768_01490 [Phycisphaeraceae bacterium]|nr:hypothetical protein [Phycisphaeraceae bacterium]